MNALYHIAILEGYLSQHSELPRNVQDAITFFKQSSIQAPIAEPKKKKRKYRMSPEQKSKQIAQLAQMREKYRKMQEEKKNKSQAA